MAKQPNLLFIQVDQMSASALSAYGNTFSITPNLDALCETGTLFENAYCNYPICAPSRFAMMAGQLPSKIDAFDNAAELSAAVPTFAHYLRAAGYATTLSGKMHFIGPDQLHGFEERLTAELYPTDFVWNKMGTEFSPKQVSDARGILRTGPTISTVQLEHDELVAFRTKRKLYELGSGDDDRPFLLVASFTHPHEPYLCRQEFWDLYEHVDIPQPSVGPLSRESVDPLSRRVADMWSLFEDFGAENIAKARRGYFANVSYVDRLIGDLLRTLDEAGLTDTTGVVFTSDHGDMLGERGLWYKKVFFEPSAKVPLLIRSLDQFVAGRVSQPVTLVDLLPTLCALGGASEKIVEPLDGADLAPLVGSPEHQHPDAFSEVMSEGLADPVVMIRSGQYKFIGGPTHPAQLYDLDDDPHELHDLANSPSHVTILVAFEQKMSAQWNFDMIKARIELTQKRRDLIHTAHYQGKPPTWDHQPPNDESRWLRGNRDYGDWAFDDLPIRD